MPQFDFNFYLSQVFWMCVSFGILFWAMHQWIMPKIVHLRQQRLQRVDGLLEEAQRRRAVGDALFDRIEQSLKQARIDAESVVAEAVMASQKALQQESAIQQAAYHAQMVEVEKNIQKERAHLWDHLHESVPALSESVVQMWSNSTPGLSKESS